MIDFIFGPREQHAVKSAAEYRKKHAAFIHRLASFGARYRVHPAGRSGLARVDANRWIVDCDCGNGPATSPEWAIALCFGCGAVFEKVIFPPEAEEIERQLVKRPRPQDRHWNLGEPANNILIENVEVGLVKPEVRS